MEENRLPPNAPASAHIKARQIWFEQYGSSVMNRNRLFIIAVLEAIVIFVMGIAIASLTPLKTVVPYVVKVHTDGQVSTSPIGSKVYQPGDNEKQYFLAEWSTKLLTLDRFVTIKNLESAFYKTRNKATSEFSDYIDQYKPAEKLKQDQSLTRSVTIRSISFVADGSALVRASLETRSLNQSAPDKKNIIITIHYSIVPPQTQQDILDNPIGLYITHFAINEDLN